MKYTVTTNLNYDPAHPEMDRLDVYSPEKSRGVAYLYFHGGGLQDGDKAGNCLDFIKPVAEQGFPVFSANYRFLPPLPQFPAKSTELAGSAENGVGWREILQDCVNAAAFVLKEGRKYADFEKLVIGGSSAGGYQSMMLFLNKALLAEAGIDGERDIAGYFFDAGQPTTHFRMLGLDGQHLRRLLIDERAPLYYLTEDFTAPETLPLLQFLLAEQDMPGRADQNRLMLTTLKNFRFPAEKTAFHTMMGYKHCKYFADREYQAVLMNFLDAAGRGSF